MEEAISTDNLRPSLCVWIFLDLSPEGHQQRELMAESWQGEMYQCPNLGDTTVLVFHVAAHLTYNSLATQNSAFGLCCNPKYSF